MPGRVFASLLKSQELRLCNPLARRMADLHNLGRGKPSRDKLADKPITCVPSRATHITHPAAQAVAVAGSSPKRLVVVSQ